jgi:hypothetical protein
MKASGRLICLCALLLLARGVPANASTAGASLTVAPDPRSEQSAPPSRTDELIFVTSAGRSFHIPLGYARLRSASYVTAESWFLAALWPGLTPMRAGNADDERDFNTPGRGRQIMIGVWFSRRNLDRFLDAIAGAPTRPGETALPVLDALWRRTRQADRFGLEMYPDEVDMASRPPNATDRPEPLADYQMVRWEDFFIRRDAPDGNINTFIRCTTSRIADPPADALPGTRIVPQCVHKFVIHDYQANVQVVYRRVYLAQWQEIEQSVRAKLTGFEK